MHTSTILLHVHTVQLFSHLYSWKVNTDLDLEAHFSLFHAVSTSGSGPHVGEASKRQRRCCYAAFVNCQTQIAVICNMHPTT